MSWRSESSVLRMLYSSCSSNHMPSMRMRDSVSVRL